jgi:N-methylhydantoinase A
MRRACTPIESGKDVTERTLIAFGGAAPLHAARVAEKLNVSAFVVPTGAGVGSAVGFLRAPVAYEIVRSDHQRFETLDLDHINALLGEMTKLARLVVEPAAFGAAIDEVRIVFMRYVGQGHEIAVTAPAGPLSKADIETLRASFEAEYSRLYSRTVPGGAVEILTWVVKVVATVDPHAEKPVGAATAYTAKPDGERRIFDPDAGTFITAAVFERDRLKPGARFSGPAVVIENETTTVVSDKFRVTVNGFGYLECVRADLT